MTSDGQIQGDPAVGPTPTPAARDHLRSVVDAAVAAIPFAGGSVQILFDDVLKPSLEKRRQEWLETLGQVVDELERRFRGFDPSSLVDNEQFVSAVMQATQIAMGTHREEKVTMLRDCLVNLVVRSPSDLVAARFLRFVQELEPEHFLVLQYAVSPEEWFAHKGRRRSGEGYLGGSRSSLMDEAGLPVGGAIRDLIIRDLSDRRLVDGGSMNTMMTDSGVRQPFATDLGRELIALVRAS